MTTNIIATDKSNDILIPKTILKKSGLGNNAVVKTKLGEIRITSVPDKKINENALLSERALAADWNRPEEDKAWMNLS